MKLSNLVLAYGFCACSYAVYKATTIKACAFSGAKAFGICRYFFFLATGGVALVYSIRELDLPASLVRVIGAAVFIAASGGIFFKRFFSGAYNYDFMGGGARVLLTLLVFVLVIIALIGNLLLPSLNEW
jgi:hypothetical protein